MKTLCILLLSLSVSLCTVAQDELTADHALLKTFYVEEHDPVYKIKPAIDIPVTAVGAGWTLYAFSNIYNRDRSSVEQINALNPDNINGFDRWAYKVYSEKAAKASDYFLYGAMPLPLFLLFDKSIRSDFGKISLLYLEAMAVTGTLYSTAAISANRYRPYAYNPEAPMGLRQGGGAKNSFFAGHVALVGTSTFFIAKVFSDYHPTSGLRPVLWTAAAVATGMTGYLRHRGGRHFPSDILTGAAVGTLSGILIPQFHKIKLIKNQNMTLLPYMGDGSRGIAMIYRLG
jgi:membrane-associated phospholipid phosphatase